MKILPALLVILALIAATDASAQTPASRKKGVGLAERHGMGAAQLEALDAGWYYNWGSDSALKTSAQFVPMIFSEKHIGDQIRGDTVMGYNEPDHEKQSNIPVKDALARWPEIAGKAKNVGSPATAGNPVKSEWMHDFMKGHPKVSFIAVHWYKGADAKHFIRDMEEIHAKFGKPLWVTEFAPQTAAHGAKEGGKYSQAQVNQFITETIRWMEATPWIERYAWHDAKAGTSALFDESRGLTATGKHYAATR